MPRETRSKGVPSERRWIRREIRGECSSTALYLKFEFEFELHWFYYPLTETLKLYYNSYRLCDVLLLQEINVVLH